MSARFRRRYGAGPGHLVASLLGLLVAAYGLARIGQQPDALRIFVYLLAAVVAHDLVLLPLYTVAYAGLGRALHVDRDRPHRAVILRHLVVPVVISGLLLLVWFPLILALPTFVGIQTTTDLGVYATHWALITLALFAGSGVVYGIRAARAGGRPRQPSASV